MGLAEAPLAVNLFQHACQTHPQRLMWSVPPEPPHPLRAEPGDASSLLDAKTQRVDARPARRCGEGYSVFGGNYSAMGAAGMKGFPSKAS